MKLLLFHPDKCIGCKLCQSACSGHNEGEFNPRLARLKVSSRYTLDSLAVDGHTCTLDLACVQACPVEAIEEKNGRLIFHEGLCTGCGLCADVCPEGVIIKKDRTVGICNQCQVCVTWCPTQALTFEEVNR